MRHTIIKRSSMWSTKSLIKKTETLLDELDSEGYEIVSVSFGINIWWIPTAYITVRK